MEANTDAERVTKLNRNQKNHLQKSLQSINTANIYSQLYQ